MADLLGRLREVVPVAFAGEPVAFAYLFGSHATGTAHERSDIDVAVHLGEADADALEVRLRLAGKIERHLGAGPVEVVVLDEAPISLAGRVREHGHRIYSVDEVRRVRYESLVSRQYHDFKIHEERSAHERLERLAEGR